MWNDGTLLPSETTLIGTKIGVYLDFGHSAFDHAVEVAIAISFISTEQVGLFLS
jgi:hypothetical protein